MSCGQTQTSDEEDTAPGSDPAERVRLEEDSSILEWVTDWMDEPPPYLPTDDIAWRHASGVDA
jgi:hypothetical protein